MKAPRLLYHSTLGLRVIKEKKTAISIDESRVRVEKERAKEEEIKRERESQTGR